MSHYLHHIVAKSLALTPVVRPRLASLFEPPSEGVRFAGVDSKLSDLSSDLNGEERNEPIAPFAANPEPSISPTTDRSFHPNLASPTATTPPFPSLFPAHHSSPISAAESSSPEAEPATSLPVAAPPIGFAPPIVPLPTPTSAPLPPSVEPPQPLTWNEPSPTLSPPHLISPRIEQATEPLFPNQPLPSSHRSPDRLPSSSLPASLPPPAPPTIQITIGRIEVRAIAPKSSPAPAPKPRPAKPSLEEYLRSRSGSRASGNGGSP